MAASGSLRQLPSMLAASTEVTGPFCKRCSLMTKTPFCARLQLNKGELWNTLDRTVNGLALAGLHLCRIIEEWTPPVGQNRKPRAAPGLAHAGQGAFVHFAGPDLRAIFSCFIGVCVLALGRIRWEFLLNLTPKRARPASCFPSSAPLSPDYYFCLVLSAHEKHALGLCAVPQWGRPGVAAPGPARPISYPDRPYFYWYVAVCSVLLYRTLAEPCADSLTEAGVTITEPMWEFYLQNQTEGIPGKLTDTWYVAGAMFMTMMQFWHVSGYDKHNDVVSHDLMFQAGENYNYFDSNYSQWLVRISLYP